MLPYRRGNMINRLNFVFVQMGYCLCKSVQGLAKSSFNETLSHLCIVQQLCVLEGLSSARMTNHPCYSIRELHARCVRVSCCFHPCEPELNFIMAG
jgi:hypothetical protein